MTTFKVTFNDKGELLVANFQAENINSLITGLNNNNWDVDLITKIECVS